MGNVPVLYDKAWWREIIYVSNRLHQYIEISEMALERYLHLMDSQACPSKNKTALTGRTILHFFHSCAACLRFSLRLVAYIRIATLAFCEAN